MAVSDIFGKALTDFYQNQPKGKLSLHNTYGRAEEMPLDVFFRDKDEMPDLELYALGKCRGAVLDIGAGVGSHALILQAQKMQVTALEISPLACRIMKMRGVKTIVNRDIFTFTDNKFDTLLLLMNGIGITGTIEGLKDFLHFSKSLLNPGGQLLFDSSDISYLYKGIEIPETHYFGEIAYQYEYLNERGSWFNWLYIDFLNLKKIAAEEGWNSQLIYQDDMDQYLVSLTLKS
ncbi:MAG: methyltransferase domain-containing protein [Pyrinomonadaceae bacterium]|nr:methyltransferase domain-containing protein [Sphingobacteriaceae bacterium]